jgi:hypothetical protein
MPTIDVKGHLIDFPDNLSTDELNKAVGSAAGQLPDAGRSEVAMAERASSIVTPTPTRARPNNAAEWIMRFAKDTAEGLMPPTSIEGLKRALSPNPGQYGPLRTGQEIATYGREDNDKLAESFVEKTGGKIPPALAATIGAGGSLMGNMLIVSPQDMAAAAGTGKIMKGLTSAEMAIRGAAKGAGKSLISTTLGPTKEAVDARFADPGKLNKASKREWIDIAEIATEAMKEARKKLKEYASEAHGKLSEKAALSGGGIEKGQLIENINSTINRLEVAEGGAVGPAQEKAIGILQKIKERLYEVGEKPSKIIREVVDWDTSGVTPQKITKQVVETGDPLKTGVSEKSVKEIVQQLDQNINWDDPSAGPVNDALENLRVGWDTLLKGKNKAYEKAMRPVSSLTRTIAETRKTLGLVEKPGEGIVPGASTEAAIKGLSGGTRGAARKILNKFRSATGQDIPAESKLQMLADQFKGGKTQGSRRVNLGRAIGAAAGSVPGYLMGGFGGGAAGGVAGEVIGGLAGAKIDIEGGKMAGTLIDQLARIPTMLQPAGPAGRSAMAQILASGRRILNDKRRR